MSLHDATVEKGWKCGSGAIFTINPQHTESCINCEKCTAVQGIILEDAEHCRFINGDDF